MPLWRSRVSSLPVTVPLGHALLLHMEALKWRLYITHHTHGVVRVVCAVAVVERHTWIPISRGGEVKLVPRSSDVVRLPCLFRVQLRVSTFIAEHAQGTATGLLHCPTVAHPRACTRAQSSMH